MPVNALKVTITRHEVVLDPPIQVFHVEVENEGGSWEETWGSERELQVFLRGMKVGVEMSGGRFLAEPEIPEKATSYLQVMPRGQNSSDA